MPQPLHVLIVEDNPADAELVVRELRRADYEPRWTRVDTEADFLAHLHDGFELVLSDFQMPEFTGLRALELLNQAQLGIPFIVISGTIGEDVAVAAMKLGAVDYLLKDRLARLGAAVAHALTQARISAERRQAAAALGLFRALVDQSTDTLEIVDPETGRFLDVNEKGPADLGCTREEYLKLRVCDVDSMVTPENWPERVATIKAKGQLAGDGTHRRKDGTIFPIEFSAKWVHLERDYIVALVRDISVRRRAESELRASEERFRQLAEYIQEVFWITDPASGQMLYISPGYERVWGRSCESLYAAPLGWLETLHADDRERVERAVHTKQVRGDYDEEFRIIRPDGALRWIRDRAFPVRSPAGTVLRIVGVAEDITDTKRLHEQFLRAQRMEAIGTLAGGIAHDLNNILAPVLLAPTLLRSSVRTEHERQLLDLIEQGAKRGSNIVRQLLTFSRGTGGDRVSIQLRHLLKEMTGLMRETFPRDLAIEERTDRTLWPILGDPTQLHQVLMNLCVNARDAMPNGGRLSLAAKNVQLGEAAVRDHAPAKAGPYVLVTVTDTGHGIPPAIIDRIFDPFFTTKPPTKGTGLGLSTVLGIVRSHSGFITVASAEGRGTSFSVHLPAAPDGVAPAVEPDLDAIPHGKGETILVVDDEEPIRTAVRWTLEQHGYRVLTASEGAEALALFLKNRAHVRAVVTDVMMPVMGGLTLIRALRAVDPILKILATSGLNDQANYADLIAAGVNEVLPKPCGVQDLLQAIHQQLQ